MMRRAFSMAGAAVLAVTTLVTPASAQTMRADGSCGMTADRFGLESLDAELNPHPQYNTVPNMFYEVTYQGVPAPTTVGVIIRYGGELEEQLGVSSFVADRSSGVFRTVLASSTDPSRSGGGTERTSLSNRGGDTGGGGIRSNSYARSIKSSDQRAGASTSTSAGNGQYIGSAGGLGPGLYTFYVYTGEIRNAPETVKDGPAGPRFFADEKGFLGMFECALEDDK